MNSAPCYWAHKYMYSLTIRILIFILLKQEVFKDGVLKSNNIHLFYTT